MGRVLLISSGETSASAHEMFEHVFEDLRPPVRVAIMETPAGFEPNSALVAQRVSDFLKVTMKNYSPSINIVPVRRRDGPFSTNSHDLLNPMLEADCLYLGAGSPSYLITHLRDTLAWRYLVGRHRQGAAICLASAAAIAFGSRALPVYEIYKAGHDLHWLDGLDFFGRFGLDLAVVSHWNNREGGAQLDTSRCFMGRSRMERLRKMLSPSTLVLGIDEYTGAILDFENETCHVAGKGGLTILGRGPVETYAAGATFPIQRLGPYQRPPEVSEYGPLVEVASEPEAEPVQASQEAAVLLERRDQARRSGNWPEADSIRQQLSEMGFEIQDTPEGSRLYAKKASRKA